jgi:uncharacterized membrane protein YhaH (DUF805 family)
MGFGEAIASGFNNYATFKGRAPRSEYWWWVLFFGLFTIGAALVSAVLDVAAGSQMIGALLRGLVSLAFILPNLAVGVRRLHDLNRSGWWLGGSFILALFLMGLAIPVAIRAGENHAHGYAMTDGVPSSACAVMALLGLAYIVYGMLLFIWFCMRGTSGPNRFGAEPLKNF